MAEDELTLLCCREAKEEGSEENLIRREYRVGVQRGRATVLCKDGKWVPSWRKRQTNVPHNGEAGESSHAFFPKKERIEVFASQKAREDESFKPFFRSPKAAVDEPVRKVAEPPKTGSDKLNPFLVTFNEPGSVAAEQFRKLKTKIHRLKASNSLKTILITSSVNGEGKSFTAANLGVSLAREIHNRVLMIDCDLRNPGLTKYFGLENEKGLSELIQGMGKFQELVKETGVERLRVLPAGTAENAPADLIASSRMKMLLKALKSHAETEFVIIDSTPILATTEPEVLSALVDGIILVVRAGSTPRETVEQALASLGKERILGAVLNDLVFRTAGLRSSYFGIDGYYYKYGYGYGNRQEGTEENKRRTFRFRRRRRKVKNLSSASPEHLKRV